MNSNSYVSELLLLACLVIAFIISAWAWVFHQFNKRFKFRISITWNSNWHRCDWFITDRTHGIRFQTSLHISVIAAHLALGARTPFGQDHMLSTSCTEWNCSLAAWTVKSSFRDLESAERTRTQRLWVVFLFNRFTCNLFNLCLEFRRNFINILRSDQNTGPLVSLLFQITLWALSNSCSHNVDHIIGELADVLANSNQQACSS